MKQLCNDKSNIFAKTNLPIYLKMKKVLSLLLVAGMATIVSCGPSAEEKAAAEKAIQDSIANVAQMQADSLAAVEMAAQEAAAAAEKMVADSIAAAAEAAASAKKPTAKTKPAAKPAPANDTRTEKVKEADKKVEGKFGKK